MIVRSWSIISSSIKLRLARSHRSLHLGEHFSRGSFKEIQLTVPVPLAGRKYLPSYDTPGFPKFLSGPRENFPLLVKARNEQETTLTHWAKRSREVIEEAYRKYEKDGSAVAILFRGLPVTNEKDLSEWVNGLGYEHFSYVGGTAPRVEIERNVAGGSNDPKEFTVELHNEMSYNVNCPKMFIISSLKTAPQGGETAISDVRDVFAKLDPSFVERCERKLIQYWRNRPDEKTKEERTIFLSWQHQFHTQEMSEVEDYLNDKGYSFEWDGTTLSYSHKKGPFIFHPVTGECLWFNQVAMSHCSNHKYSPLFEGINLPSNKYPAHSTFGDGEEIKLDMIHEVRRVSWESAVGFKWQDGDVLFLDNLVVQHSRLSYQGGRKVGVSLLTY